MKAKKPRPRHESEWFSRKQAAAAYGVSLPHFDSTIRPLISDSDTRRRGRELHVHMPTLIGASIAAATAGGELDPLLVPATAVDSPALERYRAARATQEEMRVQELQRTLLPVEHVQEMLRVTAEHIRGAGQDLERAYGAAALAILNEAIGDAKRHYVAWLEANAA